jgi:hypothetical protein
MRSTARCRARPRANRAASRKALVVGVLGFEDPLLDADVARDPVALCEQLVSRQQSCDAAVAVGDRVNREEVDDKRGDQRDGMRELRSLGRLVAIQQLAQKELRLVGRGGREGDLAPAALVGDDQILVALEVTAPPAGVPKDEPVQVQDERNAQGLVCVEAHQRVDRVAIAGELALVAIAKARRALGDALRAPELEQRIVLMIA